jgi:hypothetical protein
MKYITFLALAIAACADPAVTPLTAPAAAPSLARTAGPPLTVSPASLTLAVGETATVAITYNVSPVPHNFIAFFWGCVPNGCYSVVQILPSWGSGKRRDPAGGATAQITGLAPGTADVWASDGLGAWATVPVTVRP